MRGLKLSGFAVVGWGAYNLSAAVILAGLAMISVGFWFWRLAGGQAELGVSPTEATFRGEQASATTEPASEEPQPTDVQRSQP